MRNFILLLLVAFVLPLSAQVTNSVTFDFANPKSLNPQITPKTSNGSTEFVTNEVFHNGPIDISFTQGAQPIGAYIFTKVDKSTGEVSYNLTVSTSTSMKFAAKEGVTIQKIQFSESSLMGSLDVAQGQPGSFDFHTNYRVWTNGTTGAKSVTLYNNQNESELTQITVTYSSPVNILTPTSTSITNGQTLDSFQSMDLNFSDNVSVVSGAKATLTKGTNVTNLTLSASGSKISLKPASPVTASGTYTLTIPAGSIRNNSGNKNPELTYTFSISDFHVVGATPAFGEVKSIPNEFTVTFSSAVGKVDNNPLTLMKDGTALREVYMSHPTSGSSNVVFTIANNETPFTEKGVYTVEVPAGVIHNTFVNTPSLDVTNSAFTIRYEITEDTPPVTGDSETMQKAKALLDLTGIGYPIATSKSRTALSKLVNSTTTPSDERLQTAIDALYAETNIELPSSGNYYRIEAVSADGNKLYLQYKDNAVVITDQVANASAFKAIANANGTLSFQTTDQKYLHVLTALNNYDNTSTSNVTASYISEVNDLKVQKLSAANAAADKQYGYMSIYGCLGTEAITGTKGYTYVMLNHSDGTIPTSIYSAPAFTNTMSSAFTMVQVPRPAETYPAETVAHTITPDYVNTSSNVITIKFTDNSKTIALTTNASATIVGNGTSKNVSIETVSGQANTYCIRTDGLASGTYTLTVKEGSFAFMRDDATIRVKELTKQFSVDAFNVVSISYSINPDNINPVFDTDLNNIVFTVLKGGQMDALEPDVNRTVSIVTYFNQSQIIRTGHLEKCDVTEYVYGLRLVLDSPISKGELAKTKYTVIVPEGTFGNANFGKYVNGNTSVRPSDCKVNMEMKITFKVDNQLALKPVETAYTLTPDVAESTADKLTLTFPDVKELSVASDVTAYFADKNNVKIAEADIESNYLTKNEFTIKLSPLSSYGNDEYRLVIPEGGFTYTKDGREVKTTAINAIFAIGKNGSADDSRISFTLNNYTVAPESGENDFVKDVQLNNIMLTAKEGTTLCPNKARKAALYGPDNVVVAAGVFEKVENATTSTIRFAMERTIPEGLLEAGVYTLKVKKGTFGDENFEKFITDRNSVKPEDCVANPEVSIKFYVDNANAVKTVNTKYTISPAVVESTADHLTLTFPEVDALSVAEGVQAQFNDADGKKVANATFTADAKKNVFTIALSDLDNEDYTLVIPEGAFLYVKNNRQVKTQAISHSFTIGKYGSADDERISFTYSGYTVIPESSAKVYVHDTDLNNISVVAAEGNTIAANTQREATIVDVTDMTKVIAKGHFENVVTAEGEKPMIRLVLDNAIGEGTLSAGVYMLQIAQGTFGNEEFGKFLNDKKSVNAEDCVANAKTNHLFYLDNSWTGIHGIHTNGNAKNTTIYTLQGVKLDKITSPGIYIVNGKKIVITTLK